MVLFNARTDLRISGDNFAHLPVTGPFELDRFGDDRLRATCREIYRARRQAILTRSPIALRR
jgi:hypothetical protein